MRGGPNTHHQQLTQVCRHTHHDSPTLCVSDQNCTLLASPEQSTNFITDAASILGRRRNGGVGLVVFK